jgi:aspartate kinase
MKFGGTSVGSPERIRDVTEIVKERLRRRPIVVVSALSGVTDRLILAGKEAAGGGDWMKSYEEIVARHKTMVAELGLPENLPDKDLALLRKVLRSVSASGKLSDRKYAVVVSFGERMSSKIVAANLLRSSISARAVNLFEVGLLTDSDAMDAQPLQSCYADMAKKLKSTEGIPVVTGFLGANRRGHITTLGRGGSDFTATIIGAAVDAAEIEIWTDVSGIMTADPRVVPDARVIGKISLAEAAELAYFGANVLHPKTLLPAMKNRIPVRILNTFRRHDAGTLIVPYRRETQDVVKAIAAKKGVTVISVTSLRMLDAYGFLARVFEVFGKHRVSVDVISTSEVNISLTVDQKEEIECVVAELSDIAEVSVREDRAIVCVVGEGMRREPGIAGRIFCRLGEKNMNVEMISQGASEINISFIVCEEDADQAVRILHDEFFGKKAGSDG